METIFPQIDIQEIFLKLIDDTYNDINMIHFIDVDQVVIQVDHHKDARLFCQDHIDVLLEICRDVG